ncbi:MAG: hypothetical protein CL799_12770 [Chromatiales bacterium]|jgi:hypothetical protein|nr:hypothetical protein [Chromatiales bacterium]MDP6150498.1 hypothetical protein [Gammaproteobacteria bacterium]MDP7270243.1 hypothetical protein [Gammaproteobacteria bacterium]HJP05179.1 hypothetical protein [Gammaproteobacteria bacterium]
MNQDERLDAIIERIGRSEVLEEQTIPPELAEPRSVLKVLTAKHRNWSSERFRKIFGMRFSVKLPPLEQINSIFYPRPEYDIPVFIFFCLLTKRKVIAHLNMNCPFDDPPYRAQWVDPLVEMLNGYPSFETQDRYPEWMKKYRNDCTIYGLFPNERLQDLSDCCLDYLDYYSDQVAQAVPVKDPGRLNQISTFQDQWVDDIRTQDKAQGMIAKMIGKKTARRIFYEVTT